jgi:hypothetical protein
MHVISLVLQRSERRLEVLSRAFSLIFTSTFNQINPEKDTRMGHGEFIVEITQY